MTGGVVPMEADLEVSSSHDIGLQLAHLQGISRTALRNAWLKWCLAVCSTEANITSSWRGAQSALLPSPAKTADGFLPYLQRFSKATLDQKAMAQSERFCKEQPIRILVLGMPGYPVLLSHIPDPPLVLFVWGNETLLDHPKSLSIVGARKPTPLGEKMAFEWAAQLASEVNVVSGLALGIDGAAHRGALASKGATMGVLGSGFAEIYPPQHRLLAKQIAAEGLLITEYPPFTKPQAHHFPARNRIISGLTLGIVVIEASLKSGSLITARLALEQGREVLAMPGSVANRNSQGTHALIQEGAYLVTSSNDILGHFGWSGNKEAPSEAAYTEFPEALKAIFSCIGSEYTSIEEVVAKSGVSWEKTFEQLTELEWLGVVSAVNGGYVRTEGAKHNERERA